MADDKSKRDLRDRNRVSADDDYDVEYFARENGCDNRAGPRAHQGQGHDRVSPHRAARALRERNEVPDQQRRHGIFEARTTISRSSLRRSITSIAPYADRISICAISARCFIMRSPSINRCSL
ncbi:MAG: DUF3606 domain-containing protein [Mesorhizobium sp.]|nr:DUF3606 domain-containing protein [Mesorhizobium sp.]RWO54214.1 MAG: DUF3606 domain-containing protein [Mesorhizobium sp.]